MPNTQPKYEVRSSKYEESGGVTPGVIKYEDLEERTFKFAVRVVKMVRKLPKNDVVTWKIGGQLVSSATSINSNIVQARAAVSKADFTNHMRIARKEAKETIRWIQLLVDVNLISHKSVILLLQENEEIIRILVKTVKTAEKNSQKS